jgi:hypothetical protein
MHMLFVDFQRLPFNVPYTTSVSDLARWIQHGNSGIESVNERELTLVGAS